MTDIRSGFSRTVWGLFISMALFFGGASSSWCAESDYYGTYAGNFSGDDNGVWVAVISSSSSDSVFLSYSTDFDSGDGGYLHFSNESGTIGYYYTTSLMNESDIDASIDSSDGSVTGTWSTNSESGTVTGDAITSSAYAGSYSGTFSGDDSGNWSMTVASNGYISGSATSGDDTSYFEGGCHPDGYIVGIGTNAYNEDFVYFGHISDSCISGSWESESGDSGTFGCDDGDDGDGGDGGGGGGGGGCFISTNANGSRLAK